MVRVTVTITVILINGKEVRMTENIYQIKLDSGDMYYIIAESKNDIRNIMSNANLSFEDVNVIEKIAVGNCYVYGDIKCNNVFKCFLDMEE
jgi:hypothetical protein